MSTTTTLALMGAGEIALDPGSPEFREHVETGAAELARIFHESTTAIRRNWDAIQAATLALDEAMKVADHSEGLYRHRHFKVGLYYEGRHQPDYRGEDTAINRTIKMMGVRAWALLIDHLGVKNLMSVKRREAFDKQISNGEVPEVTADNIISTIMGLVDMANEFATEAAKETLALLTPASGHYKTNSGFKVGRRVVLSYYLGDYWGGQFRTNYHYEKELIAIDGTFHVLDEKGPIKGHRSPLIEAINNTPSGRGETDYFRFKCYKNRNLHLEFKRLDLVKKLNGLATGEFVLGQDED